MLLSRHFAAFAGVFEMANDYKSGIVNDDRAGKNDPNRENDTARKPGQQSQETTRRQQDGSLHPKDKSVQQGGSDNQSGQQSQGGSQNDSGGMRQRSDTRSDEIRANDPGQRGQSK